MFRKILLVGAGKSTSYLIDYLLTKSASEKIHLTIGDVNPDSISKEVASRPNCKVITLDVFTQEDLITAIKTTDIVISMLPARFHLKVAEVCLKYKKHLVTASYVSPEIKALDKMVKQNGLIFMNEIGLDPGIDHMSAMKIIDDIRDQGGKMLLFESFCGGLVAPEHDNNLWNYKFTWNPRNVVLAGQGGTAKFIQEGTYKYIPYHRLFRRTEYFDVEGFGRFEGYANRDSLNYREAYGLQDALTIYRGTMRRVGFSKAWNLFVQLGATDDSYSIEDSENMSYREFINLFLPYSPTDSVELKLRHYLKIEQDDIVWDKLLELNLFDNDKKINIPNATPAQALQKILEDKWTLRDNEKDMIVMYHKFGYELNGEQKQIDSKLVVIGENQKFTAMAKTVGLPVAIVAIQILNKKITTPGVQIPITKEVYEPILKELDKLGIHFKEYDVPYLGYNPDSVMN